MKSLVEYLKTSKFQRYLRIDDSWAENEIPDEIALLPELANLSIDVDLKRISPKIGELKGLTGLNITGPAIDKLPPEIAGCTELRSLHLYNLPSNTNFDFLAFWPDLENLTIQNSALAEFPAQIRKITNLKSLNLSNNNIKASPNWLAEMQALVSLEICDNPLESIAFGPANQALQQIKIANAKLPAIPDSIAHLANLRTLYLADNAIKTVSEGINSLHQLESFNILRNPLEAFPENLSGLRALKYIQFDKKWLETYPPALLQLPALTKVPKYAKAHPATQEIPALARECCKKKIDKDFALYLLDLLTEKYDKVQTHPQARLFLCQTMNIALPSLHVKVIDLLTQQYSQPISKGATLAVVGTTQHNLTQLKARLKTLGIDYSPKITAKVTHIVLGKNPKTEASTAANTSAQLMPPQTLTDFLNGADTPYLLDAAPDNSNSQNLSEMLLSDEPDNINVALQILQGGGVPNELITDLLLVLFNTNDAKIRQKARKLLEEYGPASLLPAYTKTAAPERFVFQMRDVVKFDKYFDTVVSSHQLDAAKILAFLRRTISPRSYGHNVILARQLSLLPLHEAQQAIAATIKDNNLDLAQFDIANLDPKIFLYRETINNTLSISIRYTKLKQFPDFIAQYTNLMTLDISNNKLTTLPDSLADLPNLKHLHIPSNAFKTFPAIIYKLKSLESLSFSLAKLADLPEALLELPLLEHLQINNLKSGALPPLIFKFKELKTLRLYHDYKQLERFSDEQRKELSEALPNTDIYLR